MSKDISEWTQDIHVGDARDQLADLPESSVHCVMTSPPYWNLRDYGEEEQLGLEDTPEQFVKNLAAVFDEVKRVLRPDGSLWLNLGDTYDDKDLQQIPARVALALQDRGWILRNRVTWAKPNPMPQSVKDRLNDTTEAVFHFVKNKEYWYDLDAIREAHADTSKERMTYGNNGVENDDSNYGHNESGGVNDAVETKEDQYHPSGKNPGDVFEVTTKPFSDAHFAVYPPELCEKPLKATCPPTVCAECGAPYERETSRETVYDHNTTAETGLDHDRNDTDGGDGHDLRNGVYSEATFDGWSKPCDCDTDETQPGVALDPFAGAGTTCLVAKRLGRRFIGVDLNPDYVALAQRRVGVTVDEPHRLPETDEETVSLGAFTDGGGRP